ncbi:hypothetical protein BD626DRAFT_563471 [Schizophyllum amplum]|uniref:Uncharacterized protein n=1 Tax=Schizophyllum amplum TaxID=97359 RepID=A0A550CY68_9AGAR|nr:hypothetical protein BD626DRAFT_563471 [Auriculariopsis ampla]
MAMKRKFDNASSDDEDARDTKQLKLVPFPSYSDDDSAMSDAESLYHHERYSSNASTSSNASSYSATFMNPLTSNPPSPTEGRRQPGGFMDHGTNCTQIPKLRVACAAGPNGRRAMWSHCEQCGNIWMVDCD